jgi:hypothetical protein
MPTLAVGIPTSFAASGLITHHFTAIIPLKLYHLKNVST